MIQFKFAFLILATLTALQAQAYDVKVKFWNNDKIVTKVFQAPSGTTYEISHTNGAVCRISFSKPPMENNPTWLSLDLTAVTDKTRTDAFIAGYGELRKSQDIAVQLIFNGYICSAERVATDN